MLRPVNGTEPVQLEPIVSKASETASLENLKAYASKPNGLLNPAVITGEDVAVSTESREKLAKLKEAEFYARQSEPEDVASRKQKVERLKALVATGTISEYFNQLDTQSIADSMLRHPLRPSLT